MAPSACDVRKKTIQVRELRNIFGQPENVSCNWTIVACKIRTDYFSFFFTGTTTMREKSISFNPNLIAAVASKKMLTMPFPQTHKKN